MTAAGKRRSAIASSFIAAANRESRKGVDGPSLILLHYTGIASAKAAIDWLVCERSRVSCHYLVDEAGEVTQMVEEHERAWHAGESCWQGLTDINSASIGIEVQNPGHELGYPPFPEPQMAAVEALCLDIMRRHGISGDRVIGHSDVAPTRKADPGEKFDWARLGRRGVGVWREAASVEGDAGLGLGDEGEEVARLRAALGSIGFGIAASARFDPLTEQTVTAFQRHWRQQRVDGRLDRSTLRTLESVRLAFSAARAGS
ncbi:MAG: N-acetylmuramoyl-L-alanine amidase [Hyphomicrobiaceae bacterium]|nr:MAG: N-acetylmuramoyl-L-alanine amidase [Hyphomicrobiaceae bacterium]